MSNGVALLLEQVLTEQAEMSAVELFSELHEVGLVGEVGWYRNLMPASPPGPGQQYGFCVDLDSCTGCKACVTACHRRNGLDEGESWRSAGALEASGPQVVTTACHHCVEPACLAGCPVNAYEKDPLTGIVVHLDDQCIGCGYCLMTCPYEVPRLNDRLGIVRKCDMCRGRLGVGEAPACVEACPNGAIRVSIVDVAAQREAALAERFLVGAPSPTRTVPSTVYRSKKGLDTVVGDRAAAAVAPPPRPGRSELPLVATLVLSQLAAGAALAGAVAGPVAAGAGDRLVAGLALATLAFGAASVAASMAHLGRPRYAWRAVLGLRHSWLSREVLAIGVFVGLAAAWAGAAVAGIVPDAGLPGAGSSGAGGLALGTGHVVGGLAVVGEVLGWVTAAAGAVVVACSVMVYAATGRRWWRAGLGAVRFTCTAALGALAALAAATAVAGAASPLRSLRSAEAFALVAVAVAGVGAERLVRRGLGRRYAGAVCGGRTDEHSGGRTDEHSGGGTSGEMAGTAALLARRGVRQLSTWRLVCTIAGALVLGDAVALAAPGPGRVLAVVGAVLVIAGELAGRSIFFVAVSPARMPGGRV